MPIYLLKTIFSSILAFFVSPVCVYCSVLKRENKIFFDLALESFLLVPIWLSSVLYREFVSATPRAQKII